MNRKGSEDCKEYEEVVYLFFILYSLRFFVVQMIYFLGVQSVII
jgi:hypothetical protein